MSTCQYTTMYFGEPGDRNCGPGVSEVLNVIHELERHTIPSCITGAKALAYYGAGRVSQVCPSYTLLYPKVNVTNVPYLDR